MYDKIPLKLFLDINGTVIAQDTARGKDNKRAYIQMIAEIPTLFGDRHTKNVISTIRR